MKQGGSNITDLLVGYGRGDKEALNQLMPIVYDELCRQAARYLRREQAGHTLQTTALSNRTERGSAGFIGPLNNEIDSALRRSVLNRGFC